MSKLFLSLAAILATLTASAQTLLPMPEWTDACGILAGEIVGGGKIEKILITPQTAFDGEEPEMEATVGSDGRFEISVPMYATRQMIQVEIGEQSLSCVLTAADTVKIVFDTAEQSAVFSGPMGTLNNEIQKPEVDEMLWHRYTYRNRAKADGQMSPVEFASEVLAWRDADIAKANAFDLAPETKEWIAVNLKSIAAETLFSPGNFLNTDSLSIDYLRKALTPETTSLMLAYVGKIDYLANIIQFSSQSVPDERKKIERNISEKAKGVTDQDSLMRLRIGEEVRYASQLIGSDESPILDAIRGTYFTGKLEIETPLTEQDLALLAEQNLRPMQTHFLRRNQALLDELARRDNDEKYFTIHKTPENSGEEFLSETCRQFLGKVILIDFWGTWCGPCRAAIKKFKENHDRLTEKGLVTLYVTDEKSPEQDWQNMTSGLHGHHFRLKETQSHDIFQKFSFTGWPSYLVIDKQGRFIYSRTAFHQAEMVEAIEKAMAE